MRGRVTLQAIQMVNLPVGWRIRLAYRDVRGGEHATDYDLARFRIALTQGIVPQEMKALGSLATLSINRDDVSLSFTHMFGDGFVGHLGTLGTGTAGHIVSMMIRYGAKDRVLWKLLDSPRSITLRNTHAL